MRSIHFIILALLSTGCSTFEYDIVQPAELAQHVNAGKDITFKIDPIQYYMRSYENRLVIQIYNPGSQQLQLLGTKSAVVDPDGLSHPLRDLSIAPGSSGKLILPPFRPAPRTSDAGALQQPAVGSPNDQPGQVRPPGFGNAESFYDPSDDDAVKSRAGTDNAYFWDWDGESEVHLNLVFQQGDRVFHQQFQFHRKRM